MSFLQRMRRRLTADTLVPLSVRSSEHLNTRLFSLYDEPFQPSDRLIETALQAAQTANRIELSTIEARPQVQRARLPQRIGQWPGEHYRLLAALTNVVQPRLIVEIGTHLGWSALAMKTQLPSTAKIVTFDIVLWNDLQDTGLEPSDFENGSLVQEVADLSDSIVALRYKDVLADADMIFMDGPHDGCVERKIMDNLRSISFRHHPLFIFDDIKMEAMLSFWRDLQMAKLDITSFGHWSGTGLAE